METDSYEYSTVGNPKGVLEGINVQDPRNVDPVQVFLPGKFMNKAALQDFDNSLCPNFMMQRCSKNWDKFCTIYLDSMSGGGERSQKDQELFVAGVVDQKFCRLDDKSVNRDSTCRIEQQLMNPQAANSPIITKTVGSTVFTTAPLSPYYNTGGCTHICDKIDLNTIQDDPLFKMCLETPDIDPYKSVLDTVCRLSMEQNVGFKTDKLAMICNGKYASEARNGVTNGVREGFNSKLDSERSRLEGNEGSEEGGNTGYRCIILGIIIIAAVLVMTRKK